MIIKGLGFLLGIFVALLLVFVIWLLWSWAMPQLWTDGPINLIKPTYWLFAAMWFLFVTIVRVIRGGRP